MSGSIILAGLFFGVCLTAVVAFVALLAGVALICALIYALIRR